MLSVRFGIIISSSIIEHWRPFHWLPLLMNTQNFILRCQRLVNFINFLVTVSSPIGTLSVIIGVFIHICNALVWPYPTDLARTPAKYSPTIPSNFLANLFYLHYSPSDIKDLLKLWTYFLCQAHVHHSSSGPSSFWKCLPTSEITQLIKLPLLIDALNRVFNSWCSEIISVLPRSQF